MAQFSLCIHHRNGSPIRLKTIDINAALAVLDINLSDGVLSDGIAEIWEGERRLARLKRRGDFPALFWEVD
jgi:hypothetical protein